ncbi:MAG: hypothetical protein ACJAYU_001823 [Bradymonadia bacterium]|jgi:hypothetical protein
MTERVDRFGAAASGLCAVHCAVCAFLPAALAALGLGYLLGHTAEWVFTLIAVSFAAAALVYGWRSHRSLSVVVLLGVGIIGLLASRGLEMGSDHHHDQEDSVHASAVHDAAADESDEHDGDEHDGDDHDGDEHDGDEHDETAHMIGASVGVAGGVLLVLGHLMNIRATKRRREDEGRANVQNSAA